MPPAERAVLFVDGNNWYHGLKNAGVRDQMRLSHAKIAQKLVGARTWVATRYYVGQVAQVANPQLYADQRRFVDRLQKTDSRISVHFGRLERRPTKNVLATELLAYLGNLPVHIDRAIYQALIDLGQRHRDATTFVEKAVDVMLAVDLVVMAERNEFDTAYVLSADGDFTHAVEAVRRHGKKVFAVAAGPGAALAKVVNSFIRVDAAWLNDCFE
jgi:uncharacterized LabA/DUF88 family protein